MMQMKEMTVSAELDNLMAITDFVDECLTEMNCPRRKLAQINVVIDEVFCNIASYAYGKEKGTVNVRVDVEEKPKAILITFVDGGKPFDPLSKNNPDVTLPTMLRPIGGLGIYITKKTMDDVSYAYKDGQNVLTIRKRI